MKNRKLHRSKFVKCLMLSIIGWTFVASIMVVKARQDLLVFGQELLRLSQIKSSYAVKNAELDAKIVRLSSSNALKSVIKSNGLVVAKDNNAVHVSNSEVRLYAINRPSNAHTRLASKTAISQRMKAVR